MRLTAICAEHTSRLLEFLRATERVRLPALGSSKRALISRISVNDCEFRLKADSGLTCSRKFINMLHRRLTFRSVLQLLKALSCAVWGTGAEVFYAGRVHPIVVYT